MTQPSPTDPSTEPPGVGPSVALGWPAGLPIDPYLSAMLPRFGLPMRAVARQSFRSASNCRSVVQPSKA